MFKIDENDKALNEPVGETNLDTTPVAEPNTPEEVTQPSGAPEDSVTETEGEPKKGAEARIRELNQKAKAAEEKAQSLEQKLAELTKPVGLPGQLNVPHFNSQEPIIAPGEEIDPQEFERRVLARADARTELKIRQSEAVNRINSEASKVVEKFPQLNPDSESFDKELSDTVTEAVEAYVKANPYSASVEKFTSRLMNSLHGAATKEAGKATENIAKQVSSAALRPTSVSQPEKKASEKSIAELESELGVVNS